MDCSIQIHVVVVRMENRSFDPQDIWDEMVQLQR